MSAGRWVVFAVAVAAVLAAVWWANDRRAPSCEERGGRRVFNGYLPIYNMVGKVLLPTLVPQYRCEGADR